MAEVDLDAREVCHSIKTEDEVSRFKNEKKMRISIFEKIIDFAKV